ncbi:MAG: DUF4493 domain-containing protein [Bacteroidales bacterium]|nr:DUF4493 domain-containing protein [Bacteroidales bacterium]
MKRFLKVFCCVLPLMVACEILGDGPDSKKGELRMAFGDLPSEETRAAMEMPDTNDFILYVTDSEGKPIYEGTYNEAPESVIVQEGIYNVRVLSREFKTPDFSSPQYGDEQVVTVNAGDTVSIKFICSQVNSGVRLKISPDFLTVYPEAALVLKSGEGSLMYSYSEKRIAYFLPGNVSLILSQGATDNTLMTRWLNPGEILSLGVGVSQKQDTETGVFKDDISISVDTSRVWIEDQFVIGEEDKKGETSENAMSLAQAMASVGKEDVWVRGYIVGGDLTNTSGSFEGPFESASNVILGPKSTTVNRSSCMAVQLSSGKVRDALNLVDNPERQGQGVCLKGDIVEPYFGLVGLKNVTDYALE